MYKAILSRLSLKRRKGFTIVELIIVIAIIAVLAAMGIPAIAGKVAQSKIASLSAECKLIATFVMEDLANREENGQTIDVMESAIADIKSKAVASSGTDSAEGNIVIYYSKIQNLLGTHDVGFIINGVSITDDGQVGVWGSMSGDHSI